MCVALLGWIACLASGCATTHEQTMERVLALASLGSSEIVKVKQVDGLPSTSWSTWNRVWTKPEPPTDRTALLLRKYDLESVYQQNPDEVIERLHSVVEQEPTLEAVHALAELAHQQAHWSQRTGDKRRAMRLYAAALIHSYQFLFDNDLDLARNAYDPQFRSICDVYNRSLEGLLREICLREQFSEGYTTTIGPGGPEGRGVELTVRIEGRWKHELFERFELVNDFETSGFQNHHHNYGLGAPLIAIRSQQPEHDHPSEKYYPPELSLPMTAFLHLVHEDAPMISPEVQQASYHHDPDLHGCRRAILSLYDPLERKLVQTGGKLVPLESDITTPLAYGLRDPLLNKNLLATASLLDAEYAPESYGMYMLEPFDPKKIPVVMVHGLWSSPTTWAHMFNDLRANQKIHSNYQFWFYAYPTAQPFWVSAEQMREDLQAIRRELDPEHAIATMDQMILVGHSMGGLVSTLQTVDSEDHFWNIVSDRPIDKLKGKRATKQALDRTFFFTPNPSIERVITIATPFQGSNFANSATRLLGQKLITLPKMLTNDFGQFALVNGGDIKNLGFLTTSTSIDSLSPSNPVFEALATAHRDPNVTLHNIVGSLEGRSFFHFGDDSALRRGDGIVGLESASLPLASSEIYLPAEHSSVHQHPGCVLEVKRILLSLLAENKTATVQSLPPIVTEPPPTDVPPIIHVDLSAAAPEVTIPQ